jgi:hypothetical protein
LLTKAEFNVETQLGHSQANSQAYLTIYCGGRLINNQASSQILIPAGAPYTTVAPQAQIADFDFANCREDLNDYYVVTAQNIQFKNLTWMISKVRDPETSLPPANVVNFAMCQYKHKNDTAGGQKGAINFSDATGSDKSCDQNGDWKTSCKDGKGDTDEVAC